MFTKEDEEKVRDYVLKASKHGISKELILFKLKSAGFEEEDVKPIIGEILKKAPKISNPKVPVPLQKKIPLKTVILIPIFIVLILIVATIIIFFQSRTITCDTDECMIDAANACKDASYNQDIEGTIFELTSNNQCLFTKKVSLLGTDEPILIQDLFSGKEMQCSYVKNNFNPELVTSLSQGLENCQGSLKDTIQLVIDSRK